jgi:hypothetical protein
MLEIISPLRRALSDQDGLTKEKACLLLAEGTPFFLMRSTRTDDLWCAGAGIATAAEPKDKTTG